MKAYSIATMTETRRNRRATIQGFKGAYNKPTTMGRVIYTPSMPYILVQDTPMVRYVRSTIIGRRQRRAARRPLTPRSMMPSVRTLATVRANRRAFITETTKLVTVRNAGGQFIDCRRGSRPSTPVLYPAGRVRIIRLTPVMVREVRLLKVARHIYYTLPSSWSLIDNPMPRQISALQQIVTRDWRGYTRIHGHIVVMAKIVFTLEGKIIISDWARHKSIPGRPSQAVLDQFRALEKTLAFKVYDLAEKAGLFAFEWVPAPRQIGERG